MHDGRRGRHNRAARAPRRAAGEAKDDESFDKDRRRQENDQRALGIVNYDRECINGIHNVVIDESLHFYYYYH